MASSRKRSCRIACGSDRPIFLNTRASLRLGWTGRIMRNAKAVNPTARAT